MSGETTTAITGGTIPVRLPPKKTRGEPRVRK